MTEAYVLAGELNRSGDNVPAAFERYERQLRPIVQQAAIGPEFRRRLRQRLGPASRFRNQVVNSS